MARAASPSALVFQLTVTDGVSASAPAYVQINVTNVNRPPVAAAGAAQTVDERAVVTLDGTGSADPDSDDSKTFVKVRRSAQWLADNFEIYPLLLFSFVQHDPTGGSIYPATWSAMLAARAEGVGSSLTSVLLFENDTVLDVLGVPSGEGWLMSSCVTFGYPTGRWGVAARRPAHEVAYRNRWGTDVGLSIDAPLWPDRDVPPER